MKFSKMISSHQIQKRSEETKRQAVAMVLSGTMLKKEICEQFKVSYSLLDRWIDKYGPDLAKTEILSDSLSLTNTTNMNAKEDDLKRRIKELENQLEMANLKSELLNIMIDIAEDELKIPIRKKYGPQQSGEKHKRGK